MSNETSNEILRDNTQLNHKVPTSNLFAYAIGLTGQNICYGFVSGWLFYYLEYIRHIPPRISGLITGVSRIWDSVNDPIVGAMVDKHRFKNGEKLRPMLILTPPIIGILSALMFMPYNLSTEGLIAVFFILYLLWDIFYSFQDVALWGMVAMSSPNSDERKRVAQWVSIGAGAGGIVTGLFPVFRSEMEKKGVSSIMVFAIFAVLFGFGGQIISMSAHKMKEAIETPKTNESLLEAIFVLRHNKTLLLISTARFFKDVFNSILPWVYFFESRETYDLGFAQIDYGNIQVIYGFITGAVGALAMFFANTLAKRFGGMKRLLIVAQIANIVCRVACFLIGFNTPSQIWTTMLLIAIATIPINSMDIAHRSLTSDSIDYVEYKTGNRTEGISFSMQNFISKISSATVQIVNGFVLHWLGHDSTKKNFMQNEKYMRFQWPIFMLGPVIGAIIYLVIISFIKDDKEEKIKIEAELYLRRKVAVEKENEL